MKTRAIFPRKGIYECANLSSSHYLRPADEKRYRFIEPAYQDMDDEQAEKCWLADCWIVDKDGRRNPGTSNCPVPINISNIGARVDSGSEE